MKLKRKFFTTRQKVILINGAVIYVKSIDFKKIVKL